MDMGWIKLSEQLPNPLHHNQGHGLCNILAVFPRAGIPHVEQCLVDQIDGVVNIYRHGSKKPVTDTVTYWMYVPEPPKEG